MPDNQSFTKQKTQDEYTTEKVDVVQNALLGDYNLNGNYVISDEIMNELILVHKERTNSFQSSIFCTTHLEKYGDLTFEILLKKNSSLNIAVAEMYLLETVEKINGYIYNTIKTPIAKFSETISNDFIAKALAMFNVTMKKGVTDDDGGKEFISEEVNLHYIETRKNFNDLVNRLTSNDFERAYEKYFNKRLGLLKDQNSLFSKEVLSCFNDEFSRIENYFFVEKKGKVRYKALNELLDNAIESVSGTKSVYVKDEEVHKLAVSAFTARFSREIETHREKAFEAVVSKSEKFTETTEQIAKTIEKKEQEVKVITTPTPKPVQTSITPNISEYITNFTKQKREAESHVREEKVKENVKVAEPVPSSKEQVVVQHVNVTKNTPVEKTVIIKKVTEDAMSTIFGGVISEEEKVVNDAIQQSIIGENKPKPIEEYFTVFDPKNNVLDSKGHEHGNGDGLGQGR